MKMIFAKWLHMTALNILFAGSLLGHGLVGQLDDYRQVEYVVAAIPCDIKESLKAEEVPEQVEWILVDRSTQTEGICTMLQASFRTFQSVTQMMSEGGFPGANIGQLLEPQLVVNVMIDGDIKSPEKALDVLQGLAPKVQTSLLKFSELDEQSEVDTFFGYGIMHLHAVEQLKSLK